MMCQSCLFSIYLCTVSAFKEDISIDDSQWWDCIPSHLQFQLSLNRPTLIIISSVQGKTAWQEISPKQYIWLGESLKPPTFMYADTVLWKDILIFKRAYQARCCMSQGCMKSNFGFLHKGAPGAKKVLCRFAGCMSDQRETERCRHRPARPTSYERREWSDMTRLKLPRSRNRHGHETPTG